MTRLHRAVYYNQERIVNQILEWAVGNKNNPKITEWIVNCVARDDYGFAPFYVAFACGHKELCTKIMEFLNQVLRQEELEEYMADEKGFLHLALEEAITFEEIEMFEFILTNSKIILGRNLLDCVSMSGNWRKKYIPLIRYRKECFQSIANYIIADDKHNNDRYKKLSDFVFLNEFNVHKMLINVVPAETLEKMFEADGGIRNWMQRFLKIRRGFDWLQNIIESEMAQSNVFRDQLMQFGREIIGERAANIFKEPIGHEDDRVYAWSLAELFKCILRCLSKESVEKLILGDDDGETITRFILSDGLDSWDTVAFLLTRRLPGEKVISTKIIDHALKMTDLQSLVPWKRYSGGFMSISLLLVDHGSDEQLRQFVDLISTPYPDKGNIWIDFLLPYEGRSWLRHHYAFLYMEEFQRWKIEREMGFDNWVVDRFLQCVRNKLSDTILQRLVCKDAIDVAKSKGKRGPATVLKKYVNDKYVESDQTKLSYLRDETKNSADKMSEKVRQTTGVDESKKSSLAFKLLDDTSS